MHVLLLACALCLHGRVSESKLSIHLIARYTPGAQAIVRAGPRVLKVLDLHGEMLRALREYKSLHPDGRTVVRIYTRLGFQKGANPEEAARQFWEKALWPPISRLSPSDRRLIDYLEGPNECEAYPAWESPDTARWFAKFWRELARLIAAAGFRPCIGSIPVGNPPGDPREIRAKMLAFAPAMVEAKRLGGAWSYHAYSLAYSTDMEEEKWTSLRYRMLHDFVAERYPELADMTLIITEAGIDWRGNPQKDGWQARGTPEKFKQWLKWFDARLREDSYVLGATLFQSGDTRGWPSFDIEPIADWLASWLLAHRPGE